jgi:D-alanyl-D-alanine dipeptidase
MPTAFDDFSAMADRDYSDCSSEAANHAMLLESIMEKYGFRGYYGEWWHYTDVDSYDVEQEFIP